LIDAGITGVRIPFYTGRGDAHDWLCGLAGSSSATKKAISTCISSDLEVEAEVVITRPTMPHLTETVAYLQRLGVAHLRFRTIAPTGAAAAHEIALIPRLSLMQPSLEHAIQTALRHEMQVYLDGIPACVVPDFRDRIIGKTDTEWAFPLGPQHHPEFQRPRQRDGCADCPNSDDCLGAPRGYGTRFGWAEFASEGQAQQQRAEVQPSPLPLSGASVQLPPPRAGRQPATRVQAAALQARQHNLGGDPMAGRAPLPSDSDTLRFCFRADQSTREIRQLLVNLAQQGAACLRLDGDSLQHPHVLALLRDSLRLSFERVQVVGYLHHLAHLNDTELFQLRDLHRVDMVLDGSDAETHDQTTGIKGSFDEAIATGQRIFQLTKTTVGVVPGHTDLQLNEALLDGWHQGILPPLAPNSLR
jgi:MoaA/NifB/PqqE/SkfB family radical SAM enzyme